MPRELRLSTRTGTVRQPGAGARALLLLAFAALVVARLPQAFTVGRFWAEEGAVYFRNALAEPWYDALFAVHTGYINLAASAATLLARHAVPLADAPLITAACALAIQLAPAVLVVTAPVAWLRRPVPMIAALLVLLAPLNAAEIWLNTITSQFHLGLCAALILAFPLRRRAAGACDAVLLVLGGLSGPASGFLAPLFAVRTVMDRSPGRAAQTLLLGGAVAVEAAMVWLHPEPSRSIGIGPRLLVLVIFVKHILLPLLGTGTARVLAGQLIGTVRAGATPWGAYAATAAAFAAGIAGVAAARNREVAWLAAAGVWVAVLSYAGALGPHPLLLGIDFGIRYEYVPTVLFGLTLLGIAANTLGEIRGIAGALTVWCIAVGAAGYFRVDPDYRRGPAWRDELARWRQDPGYAVQFWPELEIWRFSLGPPPQEK